MKELKELRARRAKVRDEIEALFKESKGADGVESLANIKSVADPKGEFERLYKESGSLKAEIGEYEAIELAHLEAEETKTEEARVKAMNRPNLGGGDPDPEPALAPFKSLGQLYVASPQWKGIREIRTGDGQDFQAKLSMKQWMFPDLFRRHSVDPNPAIRALFDNTDFDPFEAQVPDIVGRPWGGPRMFLTMIPQIPIMSDSGRYHRLTTRTEPADYSIAEGAVYPEGTFEYTDQTFSVIARGWFVPVSEWTEDDSPMVVSEIDRDLMTGTARQIAGYATTTLLGALSGKTTLAAGGESATSAIYNAITKLRVDADTEPNLISMHPNDWAKIVTEQASTGAYLFSGMASGQMMMQRWGIPVATDVGVTEGRVLVLDTNAVRFRDRRSVNVRTAMRYRVAANLTQPTGQMLHFADARFAFYARYPQGICDVTL